MKRRNFIKKSAIGASAAVFVGVSSCVTSESDKEEISIFDSLKSMTSDVVPISDEERKLRIKKAQQLMKENGLQAILLDAGTSLKYFTGLSWWPSERPMIAMIPVSGDVSYICPAFEESRLLKKISIGKNVFPWEEDESPYKQIGNALKAAGISNGKVGLEERFRYFILNGLQKDAPNYQYVSADVVTIPCRLIKSKAEIALMQKATDITIEAIKIGLSVLKVGSTPADFSSAVAKAHSKLGGNHGFALANFGPDSAFPHGSGQPQILKKGDVVLVDCGCTVEGYNSDMSRTIVFGAAPTKRQQEIWDLEKKSQAAGFKAAQLGQELQNVDFASRQVLIDAGFGPGYKLPGLPHRTGHGIGMDGHEWGNAVKGNTRKLKPGMCFSIEPNISIVGEFGVRHEDCVYMTEDGPKWFSQPSPSIDQPFA
ncbi:M24 family metallopeptidase [Polaribacter uvawellassae]|uniref:M24 family metallopeptidase n=1 Tax=Polaribacter uvawellassae TaxID=3133495 RepID=UPI00321B3443